MLCWCLKWLNSVCQVISLPSQTCAY